MDIAGGCGQWKGFMLQCSLYFSSQEGIQEQHKIAQFINLLMEKVQTWAGQSGLREESIQYLIIQSLYRTFPVGLWSLSERERNQWASQFSQRNATESTLKFCVLAMDKPEYLVAAYRCSLNREVIIELICHDDQVSLDSHCSLHLLRPTGTQLKNSHCRMPVTAWNQRSWTHIVCPNQAIQNESNARGRDCVTTATTRSTP